jgi:predicted enzyme related to lactoylglutathione lyase
MPAEVFRVAIPVPDVAKAMPFYEHLLDMKAEPVAGGTRPYFHCGGAILALSNPGEHEREWRANPDHVYIAVGDLEAAHGRANEAGALDLGEIGVQPWGERSFYCRDPFGNPLCLVDERTKFTGQGSG